MNKSLQLLLRAVPLGLCAGTGFLLARALPQDPPPPPPPPPQAGEVRALHAPRLVTDDVLRNAEQYSADWLMWARTYKGQRFSSLNQIHRANVAQLAPKWAFSTGTHGAQQCTPVVHAGMMYITGAGGRLNALRADTGDLVWSFDSGLPAESARFGKDNNRGAALYKDTVIWVNFVGQIFAHDARTGKVRWKRTTADYNLGYTRTLAPLIVKGKVILGTSGGEFGCRGFVEALDAETGKPTWTTHTIPGPGEPGHETWPEGDQWKNGGAPTWVTGSYDPELNLIYWTTGNGAPWSSENRPGDNLYCCSVLALDADSGKIRWHFQFVPNDEWDFDCCTTPILAEIDWEGERTPVMTTGVKNGFLYLLDRRTGKFLKGRQFADKVNWARGLDPVTGRPIETGTARPPRGTRQQVEVIPSALGAANWWGCAFDRARGSVILVSNETGMRHVWEPMKYDPGKEYIGWDAQQFQAHTRRTAPRPGRVTAWDLATLEKKWEAPRESEIRWGGPLVTGGDLVFTGTMRGLLQALDAGNGRPLWQFQTGSGIMAHPVTYSVNGRQYVAVMSGRGGVANPTYISQDFFKDLKNHNSSGMVFAFALP